MKAKLYFILSLVTFMNPINVFALGETKNTSEMNPTSIRCMKSAKAEWSKANVDAKIDDVVKESKKTANAI